LTPRIETIYKDTYWGERIGRKFNGEYDGYDGFHSLRCALRFARAAYAGGYRMVKKDS
jgi:hypothetical protein